MRPFEFDRRNKSDGDPRRSSPDSQRARGSFTRVGREEGLRAPPAAYAQARGLGDEAYTRSLPPSPHRFDAGNQQPEHHLRADRSARGASSAPAGSYDHPGRYYADTRSSSSTPSPHRSGARTFTGKRRASGEMASLFSDDADDLDDGLGLGRWSDLDPFERPYYRTRGRDSSWAPPFHSRRSTEEHVAAPISHRYDFERRDDPFSDFYRREDEEEKREITGRLRLGATEPSAWSSSALYRISGLRILPASTTSGRNTPRTGSETRQHVMPEAWTRKSSREMSGGSSEPRGAPLRVAASAAPSLPTATASASSSIQRVRASAPAAASTSASAPASASKSKAASGSVLLARPIANASRNIKFGMLQPHFERPLQEAALRFGVCTTLLKKICRKNGIANWPFRKICGLRKSIASMEKQVQYFDGEQKKAYAEQLRKLQVELEAYKRIGTAPTPEFERLMEEEEAAAAAASDDPEDASTGQEQAKAHAEDVEDAVESEGRVESDVESADAQPDELEEKEGRQAERVSPLQRPGSPRADSPVARRNLRRSTSSSRSISSTRPPRYIQSDDYETYRQDAPQSRPAGRQFEGHVHHDRVPIRPPPVDREYVHEHDAHDQQRYQQWRYQDQLYRQQHRQQHRQQQHYPLEPERHFPHQADPLRHHPYHERQPQPHQYQRARPRPHGMSTIGIHQRALPSIGALLYRQDSGHAGRPSARDDRSREYHDQRRDYE